MIEIKDLAAGYQGHPVLKEISLSIRQGEVLALLGPNGCGKSTLLRTVCGLKEADGGEILVDGVPAGKFTPRELAQKIAYMAQSRNVPEITADRMVLHGRFPYLSYPRRYRKEDYEAVKQAMEWTDASGLAGRPMGELSGGQRQRVYLAMALAQDTGTILMDEPTAFLDVEHQLELMGLSRRLAGQGKAIVMVLHDICLALRTADTVAVMQEGRLIKTGPPGELFESGIFEEVFHVRIGSAGTGEGRYYYYEAL